MFLVKFYGAARVMVWPCRYGATESAWVKDRRTCLCVGVAVKGDIARACSFRVNILASYVR